MGSRQGCFRTGLKKVLIYSSVFIFLVFFVGTAQADQGESAANLDLQENPIQNYQGHISHIQFEIEKIQQDKDWLSLKVKKMEDFGRFVPQRFYDSIRFKESKILSLEKLKKRYDDRLKKEVSSRVERKTKENPKSGLGKNLKKKIFSLGMENWVELIQDVTPLCLKNRLPILFSSGSAAIVKGYEPFIKNLAILVKGYDVRIIIDGYADTDPIRTRQYYSNFELGAARASAIVHSLVKFGAKPSVCKISSTGEHRFDSHKASEWKNLQRHVDITVYFISQV